MLWYAVLNKSSTGAYPSFEAERELLCAACAAGERDRLPWRQHQHFLLCSTGRVSLVLSLCPEETPLSVSALDSLSLQSSTV